MNQPQVPLPVLTWIHDNLSLLLDAAPDAMLVMDQYGRIAFVNRQAEQLFGYSASELLGRKVEVLVPPRFRDKHVFDREQYFSKNPHFRPLGSGLNLWGIRKDGKEFPVEISLNPVQAPDGTLVISSIRDATLKREAKNQFRDLLEAAPDAMVIVDNDGLITLVNVQTEQLFGYSRSELIGRPVECLIPESYREQHPRHREHYVADPRARPMGVGLELFGLRKDGSQIPVEISLSPLTTGEGTFVISAIRDVTERRLAEDQIRKLNDELEQALRSMEERDAKTRLATIIESSEEAVIGINRDGVITDWNPAATRLYGYSIEEAIGSNISTLVPASHMKEFIEISNTLAAGGRIQIETVRQRKDGRPVSVSLSIVPITARDGTVIGSAGITRDITARKQMEEALRRSEERFRLISQATKDVIWDLDIGSGRVWRSATYWERFGYPPKDMEPDIETWKNLLHPEDKDRVWNAFLTALARRADSYEIEYRFRRADDNYAVILDRAYIVYDEAGQPHRAIGAMTDLSDRRELEEQFRQAQKMEAVGRLAGGVAHDFNNLLMVINTYSEIMREQLGPTDILRTNLDQILKATDRATGLTQQLLAFSRKQVFLPRIIDMNSVVEDALKMIKRLIGEDIELKVSLGKPLWAVKSDPGQIVQILMNLCVNARDAMQGGGELTVQTENACIDVEGARPYPGLVPGNYTTLVVNDTGTGMTKEVQDHLFEPFFTTKESQRGTGLGLSTVFGIVKQSGGYIWVKSELGHGSSFTIYLPAVDAPITTTIAPEIKEVEGQGETVLLVEDDEALRESISAHLELHGYKVLVASNGVEAIQLAKLHTGAVQVLITDMILPNMSGVEIAQEIATLSPRLLTLHMSGYTDREFLEYDPNFKVRFLQKPFALHTLLETMREMIAATRIP